MAIGWNIIISLATGIISNAVFERAKEIDDQNEDNFKVALAEALAKAIQAALTPLKEDTAKVILEGLEHKQETETTPLWFQKINSALEEQRLPSKREYAQLFRFLKKASFVQADSFPGWCIRFETAFERKLFALNQRFNLALDLRAINSDDLRLIRKERLLHLPYTIEAPNPDDGINFTDDLVHLDEIKNEGDELGISSAIKWTFYNKEDGTNYPCIGLEGISGTGKTGYCAAVYLNLVETGFVVEYVSLKFLDELKKQDIAEKLPADSVLILDDCHIDTHYCVDLLKTGIKNRALILFSGRVGFLTELEGHIARERQYKLDEQSKQDLVEKIIKLHADSQTPEKIYQDIVNEPSILRWFLLARKNRKDVTPAAIAVKWIEASLNELKDPSEIAYFFLFLAMSYLEVIPTDKTMLKAGFNPNKIYEIAKKYKDIDTRAFGAKSYERAYTSRRHPSICHFLLKQAEQTPNFYARILAPLTQTFNIPFELAEEYSFYQITCGLIFASQLGDITTVEYRVVLGRVDREEHTAIAAFAASIMTRTSLENTKVLPYLKLCYSWYYASRKQRERGEDYLGAQGYERLWDRFLKMRNKSGLIDLPDEPFQEKSLFQYQEAMHLYKSGEYPKSIERYAQSGDSGFAYAATQSGEERVLATAGGWYSHLVGVTTDFFFYLCENHKTFGFNQDEERLKQIEKKQNECSEALLQCFEQTQRYRKKMAIYLFNVWAQTGFVAGILGESDQVEESMAKINWLNLQMKLGYDNSLPLFFSHFLLAFHHFDLDQMVRIFNKHQVKDKTYRSQGLACLANVAGVNGDWEACRSYLTELESTANEDLEHRPLMDYVGKCRDHMADHLGSKKAQVSNQ